MSRFKAANEIDRRTGTNILGIIVIDQLTVFGRGEVQMSDCSYMVPDLTEGSFYRSEIIIKKSRFITSVDVSFQMQGTTAMPSTQAGAGKQLLPDAPMTVNRRVRRDVRC